MFVQISGVRIVVLAMHRGDVPMTPIFVSIGCQCVAKVRSTFHFDDVLTSFSSQEDVFRATLQPLVGQAGSQKDRLSSCWSFVRDAPCLLQLLMPSVSEGC